MKTSNGYTVIMKCDDCGREVRSGVYLGGVDFVSDARPCDRCTRTTCTACGKSRTRNGFTSWCCRECQAEDVLAGNDGISWDEVTKRMYFGKKP